MYPPRDSAPTLLSLFLVMSGNGTIYLLAFSKLTPLPFRSGQLLGPVVARAANGGLLRPRQEPAPLSLPLPVSRLARPLCRRRWQVPLLTAMAVVLLAHGPDFCTNQQLQQGYRLIHVVSSAALPLLVPGALAELPEGALLAGLVAGQDPPTAAALCRRYQGGAVVLCYAAVVAHLYGSEVRRREDFVERRSRPGAAAAAAAAATTAAQWQAERAVPGAAAPMQRAPASMSTWI